MLRLRHALAYVLLFGVAVPLWIAGLLIAAPILLTVMLAFAVITAPIQALRSW